MEVQHVIIAALIISLVYIPSAYSNNANTYIVVLKDDVNSKSIASKIAEEHGLIIKNVYNHAIKGFSAIIPDNKLDIIKSDPNVKYIEKDQEVFAFAKPSNPGKGKKGSEHPPQALPTGVDRVDADLNNIAKIDGIDERIDIDIAIIDTGIDPKHKDLNFYKGISCTGTGAPGGKDQNGHGTHVAGIAAAIDNDIGVVGVTPGARLWSIKVLDASGSGSVSCIIAGIDYVTEHADEIEVANLSLGFEGTSQALDEAIANSVDRGVVYVVAAGNDYKDAINFSPANHPDVITVSAITDTDGKGGRNGPLSSYGGADRNNDNIDDGLDDSFAFFSNYGSTIEVAAPGVDILSTWLNNSYETLSGTSMASPHVTGIVALYIAEHGKPSNDTEVHNLINAIINAGALQDSSEGFIGDPDDYHEPLAQADNL